MSSHRRYLFFVAPQVVRADVLRFGISREVLVCFDRVRAVLYSTRSLAEQSVSSSGDSGFDVFMVDTEGVAFREVARDHGAFFTSVSIEPWRLSYVGPARRRSGSGGATKGATKARKTATRATKKWG